MNTNFFPVVLISLMVTLTAKEVLLLNRSQQQLRYKIGTIASTELIGRVHAAEVDVVDSGSRVLKEDTLTIDGENIPNNISIGEFKLLKNLSERKKSLYKIEREISLKENVLKAAEAKIDQRIQELKTLQNNVQTLLKEQKQGESAKIKSLVKIYENMKPRDAARIFDELEMSVFMEVIGNMKETKVAPILANMDPNKARELSVKFAKQTGGVIK